MIFRLLFLFLVIPFLAHVQNFKVLKYSQKNGLGHSIVYNVYQDDRGFIWSSTDNGLTRFDGSKFYNYNAKEGLGSDYIFEITKLNNESLLISSFNYGVVKFEQNKFSKLEEFKNILYPLKITNTSLGIFISDRSCNVYFKKKNTRISKQLKGKISNIIETSHGVLAVGPSGFFKFNIKNNHFELLKIKTLKTNTYFFSIYQLKNESILISDKNTIYLISKKFKNVKRILRGNYERLRSVFLEDKFGRIYISDIRGGIKVYSKKMKFLFKLAEDVVVNDMMFDSENRLWLATYGKGLWCYPDLGIEFTKLPTSLLSRIVHFPQINLSFLTSETEENYFQKKDGTWKEIETSRLNEWLKKLSFKRSFFYFKNHSFYSFKKGRLFSLVFKERTINCVIKLPNGNLLIGCRFGLFEISQNCKIIREFSVFKNRFVFDIVMDGHGEMIIGTDKGLYIGKNYHFHKIKNLDNINQLFFDKYRNYCWVGTNSGLYKLNRNHELIKVEGFENIRIEKIIGDNKHNIYLSTLQGVFVRKFKSRRWFLISDKTGVDYNIRNLISTSNGHLLAIKRNELVDIDIDNSSFFDQIKTFPIQLESCNYFNKKILGEKSYVALNKPSKKVSFEFSHVSFSDIKTEKIFFALNDEPLEVIPQNLKLRFYDLPYGSNTLKIYVKDILNDGFVLKTYKIINPTPFYFSPLFILFLFLIAVLLLIFFLRFYLEKVNKEKLKKLKNEQMLTELKQKALRSMLSPHFLNNAINSIQFYVVENEQRVVLLYLSKLAKLMQLNLEIIEKSFISLKKELDNVELYLQFEQIRAKDYITYIIDISHDIYSDITLVPSFIMQPFVENAIWHGILPLRKKGLIKIDIVRRDDTLIIRIIDNGIGINKSMQIEKSSNSKDSRGTKIIKERLSLLNQTDSSYFIQIRDREYENKQGTEVKIIIPLKVQTL